MNENALHLVWRSFREDGHWPTYARVDRAIYKATNESLPTVLGPYRPRLVLFDAYQENSQSPVTLTLAGLASIPDAVADVANVLAVTQWCVDLERDHEPEHPEDEAIIIDPALLYQSAPPIPVAHDDTWIRAITRVFAILVNEGIASGSRGPTDDDPHDWSFLVDRRIRRFKDVRTIEDLLAATERPGPSPAIAPPPFAPSPAAGRRDVVRVFVLMPFGPAWSSGVYQAVREGCLAAFERQPLVERADEITEIGPITSQIIERISAAHILVADLTEVNGNVMYEVGYADALGKPVVVINQDVDETPFDLKVHRQITYKQHELPALTKRVEAFIRTAMKG